MICGKDQEMSSIGRIKYVNQTLQAGKNTLSNFMTDISKFGNLSLDDRPNRVSMNASGVITRAELIEKW